LTAREPTQQRISSGAVLWAAPLFAVAALLVVLTGPVCARMRVDKLWLVIGAGQETPIDVEMAETPKEKELGLMFRTELADNQGMLFPYGAPQEVTMWMHNTYIPLDMVFIRADGTVHRIEQRAEPLSDRIISSEGQVSAVLEMAGGAAGRLGLKPGDRIRHPLFGAR
jgi:uncharacterized membrane protein (UPF0127 family)